MQKKILAATKEMIRQRVFSHLADNEIVKLQSLLMLAEETNSVTLSACLLQYWYKADFFYTGTSAGLLHPCNALLQSIGMPQIEMYDDVFAEC
jgi:hypothetical protein